MPRTHRPLRLLAPALTLLALLVALPGCSDGEGTVFTITSVPDPNGGDTYLVYRTKSLGWDDVGQRSFTAYFEVYATHTDEELPHGLDSKAVFMRMYTFDGPAFPADNVEIRFEKRPPRLLASGEDVAVGQNQIDIPENGGPKPAHFLASGVYGEALLRITNNRVVRIRSGPAEFELTLQQLRGIAKFLNTVATPPK